MTSMPTHYCVQVVTKQNFNFRQDTKYQLTQANVETIHVKRLLE